MNDKQSDALRLAEHLEAVDEHVLKSGTLTPCAALLRTQHAEIERLTSCLKWEQSRAERIGTHGPGCEKWGPSHYECALRAIERKDALLRQALETLCCETSENMDDPGHRCGHCDDYVDRNGTLRAAIKREISQ